MFDNRVLRRIFGPKRDEATGEWRKIHYGELNGLFSSSNFFRVIKLKIVKLVGHVAGTGERMQGFGGET